jgi:hypothetical protein
MSVGPLQNVKPSTSVSSDVAGRSCLDAMEHFVQGLIRGFPYAVLRSESNFNIMWSYTPTIFLNVISIKETPRDENSFEDMIKEVIRLLLRLDTANQGGVLYFDITTVRTRFSEEYVKTVMMRYNVQPVISLNITTIYNGTGDLKPQIFTQIKRIQTEQDIHAIFKLLSSSVSVDYDTALDLRRTAEFHKNECIGFLGYVGDLAVSGCVAMARHDSIHIFNLITATGLRRRSYGTTILKYTMAAAVKITGIRRFRAIASENAMGIFHQLGFLADGSTVLGILNYD